jgi:cytochrome c553
MDRIGNALQSAPIVLWLAMLSCVAPCLAQTSPDAATTQAARTLATSICGSCHGLEGRSTDPAVPIIAGQPQTYIEVQLQAFRAHSRRDSGAHEYMRLSASAWLTNDQIITGIASYFSSQAPAPGKPGDPALWVAGKQLYEKGSSDRRVPACAGCHGVNAEGLSVFPRLAGQHAQYLVKQMQMLRVSMRDSPIMLHGVVRDLSDSDMVAVATYLQSK